MQASKKVKNETKLSSGTTSVSYAAVQYIIKNLPDFNSKNILVFGLGKMGKHTCKNLGRIHQNTISVLINRTEEKTDRVCKGASFDSEIRNSILSAEIEKQMF